MLIRQARSLDANIEDVRVIHPSINVIRRESDREMSVKEDNANASRLEPCFSSFCVTVKMG